MTIKILPLIKDKKKYRYCKSRTMCEDVRRVKKKKKNGNPLSRSNFQSKSVAFNIDESHPSSFNPHASVSKQPSPQPLCVSLDPFTLTYPQKKTPTREENALRTTRSISGRVGTKAKLEQISVPLAESRNRLSTLRVPTPIYAEELTTILPREHSRPSGLVMNRKPSLPRNIRQDARAFHSTCFKRSRHK